MRTVYGLPTRSVALVSAGLILLVLLVLTDPAAAQPRGDVPDDVLARGQGSIDDINRVDTAFQAAVTGIGGKLAKIARDLLLGLLLIEMVWTLGQIVMRGGDFGRMMNEFFQRIVIAGFFLLLIDGFPTLVGDDIGIAGFILSSAEALSDATIESSIKPAAVFGDIYKAGAQIFYGTQGMFSRWAAALVWLALIFVGAIIAGIMLVIYIEIYVAFTVGILTLGFGVWKQTSGIARNFLFSAAGKIFKIFTVLMIVAVIRLQLESLKDFSAFEDGLVMIGMLIIFIMILVTVPSEVEKIVAGAAGMSAADKVVDAATYLPGKAAGMATNAALGTAGRATATGTKVAVGAGYNVTKASVRAAGDKLAATIRAIKNRPGP